MIVQSLQLLAEASFGCDCAGQEHRCRLVVAVFVETRGYAVSMDLDLIQGQFHSEIQLGSQHVNLKLYASAFNQIIAHTNVLRNAHEPLDEGHRLSWCYNYKYEITSNLAPQARTYLTKPVNSGADTSATQS